MVIGAIGKIGSNVAKGPGKKVASGLRGFFGNSSGRAAAGGAAAGGATGFGLSSLLNFGEGAGESVGGSTRQLLVYLGVGVALLFMLKEGME